MPSRPGQISLAEGPLVLLFSLSIALSLIEFLLDRVAVVTSHHSGSEK